MSAPVRYPRKDRSRIMIRIDSGAMGWTFADR